MAAKEPEGISIEISSLSEAIFQTLISRVYTFRGN